MSRKVKNYIKNLKLNRDKLPLISGLVVTLFIAVIGVHLLFGSHAAIPATPTLSDICGVTSPSDIQPPTSQIVSQAIAISTVVTPANMGQFKLYSNNGTEEIYDLVGTGSNAQQGISIYNSSTGAQIGSTFNVDVTGNSADQFTLDPSGNVYVVNTQQGDFSISSYTPSGALRWQKALSNQGWSGVYSYTDSNGNWSVAFEDQTKTVGGVDYNKTGQSAVFNSSGVQQPNNNMLITTGVTQDPITHDIMGIYNQDMVHVYTNNGTLANNITTFPTKFQMGTDLGAGGTGPFHYYVPQSIIEDSSGGYYISDWGHGLMSFDANGGYLGSAPNSGGGQNNFIGNLIGNTIAYNGDLYFEAHGIDPLNNIEYTHSIFKISLVNLSSYIAFPQGANGHLGVGAGMFTSATSNYFPSGTTPTANIEFYPWWAPQASNFTVKYDVRSIQQVESNQTVAQQTLNLGQYLLASSTAPANVPIDLSSYTTPGAYQISAHIYNKNNPNTPVGADCLSFTVGALNNGYSPASINGVGGNVQQVEVAHELGQTYVRGGADGIGSGDIIGNCLTALYDQNSGNVTTQPSGSTNLNCPSVMNSDLQSAETLAESYGILFAPGLASGSQIDKALVAQGQWGRLVGQFVAQHPYLKAYLDWNEVNNTYSNDGATLTKDIFKPAYQAIKANSANATVIGGSTLGVSVTLWQQVGAAGGFQYMDAVDMHPYPGYNKSEEEQGTIIPPQDAAPSEVSNLGILDQLEKVVSDTKSYVFNNGVSSLPITDSEMGYWRSGTISEYSQANKIVRSTILQNSIGVNSVFPFQSTGNYQVDGETWGVIGGGYGGGDAPAVAAQVTMHNMIGGNTVQNGRKFKQWIQTGVPHTYAAEYGASSTDSGNVVIVWADDYSVPISPALSGNGSISVTSEYGATSTIASGSALTIDGDVQYLSVPAGQTISLQPNESYGSNQALSTNGAAASSSSNNSCLGTSAPSNVLNGKVDNGQGYVNTVCSNILSNVWAQAASDNNPSITVTLKNPQNIDRVFVSSSGLDSVQPGLRTFDVQVSSTVGGSFTTVGNVTNAFFQRNHLITFNSQTVAQIRLINITANYSGNGDGLPPVWWTVKPSVLADDTRIEYGPGTVYDIEAFVPGTGAKNTPTPSVPRNVTASAVSDTQAKVNWTASTDTGGPGLGGYYVLRNGQVINTSNSTTTSFTDNTVSPSATYSYTIESYDTSTPPLVSLPSSASNITTPALQITPPPSTPTGVVASAVNSSQVNIGWTASTDAGGPSLGGYYVLRGGTKIATVTNGTSYQDNSVSASTKYTYTIEAFDTSSPVLISASSSGSTVTTPANTAPAPSTPTSVVASAINYQQAYITWVASTDTGGPGLGGYYIYRNGTQVGSVPSTNTAFYDNSVSASTTYIYSVKAYDISQPAITSAAASSSSITTPAKPVTPPPSAPTNTTANNSGVNQVTVSWTASTDAGGPSLGGYYVIRDGVTLGSVNPTTTSYADNSASPATNYNYSIESFDKSSPALVSSASNVANVTTLTSSDTTPPSIPTNLSATTVSGNQINLTWTASTDNVGVKDYAIFRNGVLLVTVSGISYGDSNLMSSTQYTYYVVAYDSSGNASSASNNSSATTLDITQAYTYVYGTVLISSSSRPLSFTLVRTVDNASTKTGSAVQAYTNTLGQFMLSNLKSYSYHTYSFTKTGYSAKSLYLKWPAGRIQMNEAL